MNTNSIEFAQRIGGFCVKAHQAGMPAEDICDGVMVAAVQAASALLSREEVAEWLTRLAAEINHSEPTKEAPRWAN